MCIITKTSAPYVHYNEIWSDTDALKWTITNRTRTVGLALGRAVFYAASRPTVASHRRRSAYAYGTGNADDCFLRGTQRFLTERPH